MKRKKLRLRNILSNLDAVICGTTLTLCVIFVNVNVVFRYFLNSPIRWTDEVVTSLFVWTVFMGSAYAHRKHAHLGVDIVVNLARGRGEHAIRCLVNVLQIGILFLLTYISVQYVLNLIFQRGILLQSVNGSLHWGSVRMTYTDTLRIPKWYTGVAVPLGFGIALINSVVTLIRDAAGSLRNRRARALPGRKDKDEEGRP